MPQAMLIMSVVSAVATYASGQQQAKSAANAANAESKAAWDNFYVQKNQLETESNENNNAAMVEGAERAKQLNFEQAKIKTLAGESGIAGNSVDAVLGDSYMQAGVDLTTIETNRQSRVTNNGSQVRSSYANAKRTNNQANQAAQDAYNRAPSLVGAGLQIAGAYDKYKSKN